MTVAALYVQTNGVYFGLDDVDPWDETRDARKYDGPHPVVAHPPCQRWGRYWFGGPSVRVRKTLGDDDGCFGSALEAVRFFGGVLEHPEASHAWRAFRLIAPPKDGGWVAAGDGVGWTCCVEQGHYGHRARKATWLYGVGVDLPSLRWGKARGKDRLDEGWHSTEARRQARSAGIPPRARLSSHERIATPIEFRDLLISIARSARPATQAGAVVRPFRVDSANRPAPAQPRKRHRKANGTCGNCGASVVEGECFLCGYGGAVDDVDGEEEG